MCLVSDDFVKLDYYIRINTALLKINVFTISSTYQN